MEAMTSKLTAAIDGLSLKIGTMNQEALQHMMDDFAAMLKKSTDSEMAQLRETLTTLADRLTGAGSAIGEGAGKAAEKLDKAGTDLLTRVEQVSANLASGATNLEGATQGVKEAMNDLDVTIREAAELGKQGSTFVRGALGDAEQVFGRLKSAAEELNAAGTSLERVGGRLSEAVDSVEEMTREQRLVVNAVRDATPNAMASVQRVLDLLQQTVQATATMMNHTRDSMATTSKTLGTTVAEITAGISEYSKMVAELHRRMDQELAKAVGSLDKGVVSLEEAIEELGEVVSNRFPKG
jgi:chromosome segregation ATPase